MADLVVDSSVAVKWFLPEPYSAEARRILGEYQRGALSFIAPDLINAEDGNIVWKKHTLQGLDAADAQAVLSSFRALQLTFIPTADLLGDAYELAVKYRRTVYDALYLAASTRAACPFVTADERLANAVGPSFANLVWLGDWL